MKDFITTEFENGVGRITFDRPDKRNALTREMLDRFTRGVDQLPLIDNLRVLIIQAAGSVFCAGMDLAQMQERAVERNREHPWRQDAESFHSAIVSLLDCRMPTIAAVRGPAIAGGVGLALACDIVIAGESTSFVLPEPKRGIAAAMVTPLLLRRTSPAQAGFVLLGGQSVAAKQAAAMGLCEVVVADAEFDATVQAQVNSILECSPHALSTTKQFLNSVGHDELRNALARAIHVSADARSSEDAREGLDAFLEKRKPTWVPQDETT